MSFGLVEMGPFAARGDERMVVFAERNCLGDVRCGSEVSMRSDNRDAGCCDDQWWWLEVRKR